MSLKIMILGANGFIGSALTSAILKSRDWDVYGIDLSDNKLGDAPQNSASTSSRVTSPSTRSGWNTTSRSATWWCRWWRSPTRRST